MRRSLPQWKHRFRQHLLMRGLSPRTVDDYSAELSSLFAFLDERGSPKLSSVTREDMDAYRRHLYT